VILDLAVIFVAALNIVVFLRLGEVFNLIIAIVIIVMFFYIQITRDRAKSNS
jgi:energy-coupling factor transporter transmembrane protein EcfT